MKKILFVAATVALMAAGCTKTEVINPVGNKMGFTTGMGKLTKAAGTADADNDGDVNLQAQDFRVWAYADYEDNNTTDRELDQIYDGMANMNVYYTAPAANAAEGTLGTWSPIKEYYWPGVDKNLRFFAVSGLDLGDDLSTTEKVAIAINRTYDEGTPTPVVAPTLTVKEFIVNNEAPNADLMVADFLCQNQSDKIVDLDFRHALTKVEFLFKTLQEADDVVFVQSLSVAGVKTKSTLTVSENKDESTKDTRPMNFVWATPDVAQVFTDDYDKKDDTFPKSVEAVNASGTLTEENKTLDTTVMKLTTEAKNFCTWLAMPQDITGLKVVVTYVVGERQFISEFDLAVGGNFPSWNVNQYVRYTVTLCPGKISFDASVDTWKQYDADGDKENNNQDIEYQN